MTEAVAADPADVRPVVRTGGNSNLGLWAFGAILLLGGLLLFNALNSRRQDIAASTVPSGEAGGMISAPPPLSLPRSFDDPAFDDPRPLVRIPRVLAVPQSVTPQPQVVTRFVERPAPALSPDDAATAAMTQLPPQSIVVPQAPVLAPAVAGVPRLSPERVTAGWLVNPARTVPKGTIIAAVLETALDSTRPGGARAIVSRDVRSFDGSRVLIPRGSRLYGEYAADVTSGQNRALVHWQRLTRPDGAVIDLDSPSADPLGRAGVEGKVDTHFFARFGSAILQSILDIGVGLATRSVVDDEAVIIGLPGSTQQITGVQQPPQVQPTLRVRQGTSVSVFVARDLDFSTVDR